MGSGNGSMGTIFPPSSIDFRDAYEDWATLLLPLIVVGAVTCIFLATSTFSKFPAVKGPKTLPILGNLLEVVAKGYPYCHLKWLKDYGNIFRYSMGRIEFLCICDPDLVRDILVKNFKSFHDRPVPGFIQKTSLKALVFAQGTYWTSVRSAVLPLFHSKKLHKYGEAMNSCCQTLVDILKPKVGTGASVEILEIIQAMAVDIIGQTAFGIKFNNQGSSPGENKLCSAMADTMRTTGELRISGLALLLLGQRPGKLAQGVLDRLPFSREGRANERMKYLLAEAGTIARCRSTDPEAEQHSDLLSMLSRCGRKEGGGSGGVMETVTLVVRELSEGKSNCIALRRLAFVRRARTKDSQRSLADDEVAAICVEFMLAGSDTTANTVAFAVYLLSKHGGAETKMVAEIDAFFERIARVAEGEVGGRPTFDDLHEFPYVEQVVQETLRLYPTAATLVRKANQDVQMEDLFIPSKSFVMVPVYAMHHNPHLFPDPEAFRPERFDPESDEAKNRHPYAFLPFGGGPRMCIGYKFAMEEAQLTLISLYRNFRFALDDTKMPPLGKELEIEAGIVLKPKHGIWVKVEPHTL